MKRYPFFSFPYNQDEGRPKRNREDSVPSVSMTSPSKDSSILGVRKFTPTHSFGTGYGVKKP